MVRGSATGASRLRSVRARLQTQEPATSEYRAGVTATPCAHRVLKDVLADGVDPGAAQGTLLAAAADVLRPAYEPVLLVGLELAWTAEQASGDPAGLQLVDDAGGPMVYVNLEPRETAGVRRRRAAAGAGAAGRGRAVAPPGLHRRPRRVSRAGAHPAPRRQLPRGRAAGGRRARPAGSSSEAAPKSGTTWVEEILNAHPEVLCTGEGAFFEPADRAALAGVLRRRADRSWQPVDRSDRFAVDVLCAGAARSLLDQHAAVAGVALVGDKTPANARFYDTVLACFDGRAPHPLRAPPAGRLRLEGVPRAEPVPGRPPRRSPGQHGAGRAARAAPGRGHARPGRAVRRRRSAAAPAGRLDPAQRAVPRSRRASSPSASPWCATRT